MFKYNYKEILILSIILLVLDITVLNILTPIFDKQINLIQGSPIRLNILSAILCYILLITGLYYFIILEKKTSFDAFILGIIIYGVYELTTKALLKNWKWQTVFIDTLWGGLLFSSTTFIYYFIHHRLHH